MLERNVNKKPSTPENRGGLTNFSVSGVDTKIH
jgi:hypothetical protein